MADVENQTGETNSAEATQTDASAQTASPSLDTTTSGDTAPAADGADTVASAEGADPLDGGSLLGGEEKPDGDGGGEAPKDGEGGEGDGKDEPVLIGAPDGDYDLTGALPDGTAIDVDALARITPTARALNLSNAGLAKIASEGLPIVQKQVSDGIIADVVAQRAGWEAETRASVTGGKNAAGEAVAANPIYSGKSFDDVSATAAKAIDRFSGDTLYPAAKADGTPGTFRDFLRTTGLGNHPAMMQFAYQAGALISEDTAFERGGGIPNTPKSREEKYYGS